MRNLAFRTRLTLWNAGLLTTLLLAFAAALVFGAQTALLRGIDRDLEDRGSRFAVQIARGPFQPRPPGPDGMRPPGPGGPGPNLFRMRGGRFSGGRPEWSDVPWFRRPILFGPDGNVIAPLGVEARLLGEAGSAERIRTVRDGGREYRVYLAPVVLPSGENGTVQVARELDDVQDMWRQQSLLLLGFVPLALLVGALGGSLIARKALKPVEAATQAAERIRSEERDQRLPVVGNDELARMSKTLNAMLDRLDEGLREREEALERQRRFTADASHELRTPLAQMKLRTSLALSGPPDSEADRAALEAADKAAESMTRLVQQLLDLARSDSATPALVEVDAAQEVRAALSGYTDPRLRASVPDAGVQVLAPHDAIGRIVTNLVDNALRHARGNVWVRLDGNVLTVEDDGPGVSEEALPRLGERFFRADASRTRASGGTGLGLAIVRALTAAGGGSIFFENREGGGLSVRVELRRAQ